MSNNNFHHSFVTDREDIGRYLDALKEGFGKGVLTFSSQHRKVHLEPAEVLDLSIETSIRKGKVRVTINFTWPDEEGTQYHALPMNDRHLPGK
jgi:amphi-Trp domain-containing protein